MTSTNPPQNTPSVTMTFWIGESGGANTTDSTTTTDKEEPKHKISFSQQQGIAPARIGLPEGTEPSKPAAGSYNYSGMHDHGPMVPPKEGGPNAILLGCVQAAKLHSDEYLTKVIKEERHKEKATKGQQEQQMKQKK